MKTKVLYNGMPVTLTKTYATAELKRSRDFVAKLSAKLDEKPCPVVNPEHAEAILNRRIEWVKTLEKYLS